MSALSQGATPLAATIEEVRAYLRMGANIDDAVLAGLVRSATALCEQFVCAAIVERAVEETAPITGGWQRLTCAPVRAITDVVGVPAEGSVFAFAVADYAIDIDPQGTGWVRVIERGSAGRMRVSYAAGMVASVGEVPDALRQGVIILAGQLHRRRDGDGDGAAVLPTAVAALWQPFRRMRLS